MSNPYSQPSISGYNASPPADDGTETTANQLTWAKHKTKLADPIKAFAEAIDAAASAAHGLEFGAAVVSKSSDYTVMTSDRGRFITVTGTTTITLPAAADAGSGFPLLICNTGSGIVTVDGATSETINGSVSIDLSPGHSVILSSTSTQWNGLIYNQDFSGLTAIQADGLATTDGFLVDDAGTAKRMEYTDAGLIIQTESGTSRTLATADMNTFIRCTNASAVTITLNTGTGKVGNVVLLSQEGAGQVTVSGTATINSSISSATRAQWSTIVLQCVATDTWTVLGDQG